MIVGTASSSHLAFRVENVDSAAAGSGVTSAQAIRRGLRRVSGCADHRSAGANRRLPTHLYGRLVAPWRVISDSPEALTRILSCESSGQVVALDGAGEPCRGVHATRAKAGALRAVISASGRSRWWSMAAGSGESCTSPMVAGGGDDGEQGSIHSPAPNKQPVGRLWVKNA